MKLALSTLLAASWLGLANAAEPPRLMLLIVVDGLPMRQIESWQADFAPDGLRRLLARGTQWSQAFHEHGHTVTAVGHATLVTGASPRVHGVISNGWADPDTRAGVYCTEDAAHQDIEPTPRHRGVGTSPRNLLADTVGDALRRQHPAAKVLGVSGKDRGAILPAGHQGTAYWFQSDTGRFSSSTYYMSTHPAWVHAFNARRPADALWGRRWVPLLPEAAYGHDAPDASPWMAQAGFGNRLPAQLGSGLEGLGPRFYGDLLTSPLGDRLVLDFARAAVRGERLGADKVPDLLSISLSSHDYVSHSFGPESRLSHDHLLQLDRELQSFFRWLDAQVGARHWAVMLSADHGFSDTPEWRQQQGQPAGRLPVSQLLGLLNAGLAERYGAPKLAAGLSASGVLFDEALIDTLGLDRDAVYLAAAELLRGIEGLAAAYERQTLSARTQPRTDQAHLAALRLAWHEKRSPPVLFAPAVGWVYGSGRNGATHGSPHADDQHVPILAWGPRWFPVGRRVERQVGTRDVAPTLAQRLGVAPPQQSEGRELPLR